MSNTKKHINQRMDNSLTDLVAGVAIMATGGSALSSYQTVAWANNYALITLNRIVLTYLYSGNGIFQTAIQLPIQDALAKGIDIESGELSQQDIDAILDWFEKHQVWSKLLDFWSWVRVYGGGALVINSDQDPQKPINMKRLKYSPIELYDVDRWQLTAPEIKMNQIEDYETIENADVLYLNGVRVDTSRVILGSGKRAPSYVRRMLRGWGMSEAERMLRDLNNYMKTQDVLYEILDESKLDIYHIVGLANKLLTAGGTSVIQKRIQAANQIKNYINALVLDENEVFEQKQMTFSGLAEVMQENRIGIAAALRMPMTKLFGISPSGFSTGEEDTNNYNEMVESEIRSYMKPAIRRMIEVACANMWGYVPTFHFNYPPMREIPQLEKEQIIESKTNRLLAMYDRGLINADGFAQIAAKEEIIDADAVKLIVMNPIPPNGNDAITPTKSDTISVYKKGVDSAKATAETAQKAAFIGGNK